MLFDVLHLLDGRAVRLLPYRHRRELPAELALEGPAWRTPRQFVGEGKALIQATAEQGLEGIDALAAHELASRGRRTSVRWAAPVVEVDADIHGPVTGAVRDAVLRSISFPGAPSQHGGTSAAAAFDERTPAD